MKIRRFVQGQDEAGWVRVRNAAYKEDIGMRRITVEEFKALEEAPEFDPEGRFLAELESRVVGIIHAHVACMRRRRI